MYNTLRYHPVASASVAGLLVIAAYCGFQLIKEGKLQLVGCEASKLVVEADPRMVRAINGEIDLDRNLPSCVERK